MSILSFRLTAGLLFIAHILPAQGFGASIQITQNIACFDGADGALSVVTTPSGSAYTYHWSDGQTGAVAEGLVAGAYAVTVQNASGATVVATAVLAQPDALVLMPLTELPLSVDSVGQVAVETTGGVQPWYHQWTDADNQLFSETEDLENAPAGIYSLHVTDANGCVAELSQVVLVETSATGESQAIAARFYPNPAEDYFVVEFPDVVDTRIQIFNASGQAVYAAVVQGTRHEVNLSQWRAGCYSVWLPGMRSPLKLVVL
jgi:hypothetical protein